MRLNSRRRAILATRDPPYTRSAQKLVYTYRRANAEINATMSTVTVIYLLHLRV